MAEIIADWRRLAGRLVFGMLFQREATRTCGHSKLCAGNKRQPVLRKQPTLPNCPAKGMEWHMASHVLVLGCADAVRPKESAVPAKHVEFGHGLSKHIKSQHARNNTISPRSLVYGHSGWMAVIAMLKQGNNKSHEFLTCAEHHDETLDYFGTSPRLVSNVLRFHFPLQEVSKAIHGHVFCLTRPRREVGIGGMNRRYGSGYDSRVWFGVWLARL